jgi:cytochrome c-type biogenesis protein CcmH/NrfG
MKNHVEAIPCFQRVLVIDPTNSEAFYSLGCALMAENNLSKAAVCFKRYI